MKSRIGTINKKPIVQGDKNLVTPNEIHVSELKGGEQSNTPVEYYKVVAPEGKTLEEARNGVFNIIAGIIDSDISSFHILVKGTSTTFSNKLFTGLLLESTINLNNRSIHAYSIRVVQTITKVVNMDGTIRETPSFNNIFDAVESIEELAETVLMLKKCLVPITTEEFYNLDDLK